MKSQNKTNYAVLGILVIILIVVGAIYYAYGDSANNIYVPPVSTTVTSTTPAQPVGQTGTATSSATSTAITTPPVSETNWVTFASATSGISFSYPQSLGTNYIQTTNWPPVVSVTDNPFLCTNTGATSSPNGQTNLLTIDGNSYCVTVEGNGAAGSTYYEYAYAFPKDGKTMIMTFTLRYPQCLNYDDPKATECKNEEAGLDINGLANSMAQSVTYRPVVSPAQPAQPTNGSISLNSISPGSGPAGTTITLTGSGFTADNKVLFDGDVAASDAHLSAVTNGSQSITITVPSSIGPDCATSAPCPMYVRLVTAGTYSVLVENANGASNALSFTVTSN